MMHDLKKDNRIKVLFVLLSLEIGGMEQVVADLIMNLDTRRFVPIVACIESLGPIAAELEGRGVTVIKVPPMVPVLSFLFPSALIRVIRDCSPDAVHIHSGCWHKAALAARLCRVGNVIYTEHGRIFPDNRTVMFLDRLYSPLTRHVIVVSGLLSEYMRSEIGIDGRKISVITNGINVSMFEDSGRVGTKEGEPQIVVIARLAPVKDIGTILRAVAQVRERHPGVMLHVVGDGPERASLESLAVALALVPNVKFHGFRRDIAEVLKGMDIFVLGSLSEGTSITLLEAMAAGKPVVVTDVGGNPAIVENGVNGFLVPAGNPVAMAEALSRLIEDAELCRVVSAANIAKVRDRYGIAGMVAKYQRLYEGGVC